MMSLYAKYLTERTDDLIIEMEDGFATYRYMLDDKAVYIIDIYTVPKKRKGGIATFLADAVVKEAKDRGCVTLLGSVVPSTKGSTDSIKVLIAYGMKLASAGNDCIFFRKDI